MKFLAIDFETANYSGDSACAIGLVRVENQVIVRRGYYLIKPPSKWFSFTYIHGITWEGVKDKPTFGELWGELQDFFTGNDFLVAHNSSFDERILKTCCAAYNIMYPGIPFECTMKHSRRLWNIYPTKLPNVCQHFGIPLDHHNAASDTEACAQIMIRVLQDSKNPRFRASVF